MRTPVIFVVFNRPDSTARVFEAIRRARPSRLLVIADGPRSNRPDDLEKCTLVRKLIDDGVDWPCQIERRYSSTNFGCGRGVSSGLTWAFEKVDRAIILEDDCLPDQTFFPFCEELLERYANDEQIMHIAGSNLLQGKVEFSASYTVSRYGGIWGWATWRRAWTKYDFDMKTWSRLRENSTFLRQRTESKTEEAIRLEIFDKVADHQIDTWDYQWIYSKLVIDGQSIIPLTNLIKNIGFDAAGTHIKTKPAPIYRQEARPLSLPLAHPENLTPNQAYDKLYSKLLFKRAGLKTHVGKVVRKLISFAHE